MKFLYYFSKTEKTLSHINFILCKKIEKIIYLNKLVIIMSPAIFVTLVLLIPLGLVAFSSHNDDYRMREYHRFLVRKTQEMNTLSTLIEGNPQVSSQFLEDYNTAKAVFTFKIAQELSRSNTDHLPVRIADIKSAYKNYLTAVHACTGVSE